MKKILLSSLALIVLALSIALVQISSCTKAISQQQTKVDTVYACPSNSINGLWVGTYYLTGAETEYMSLTIEPNGTAMNETYADYGTSQNLGSGTWKMKGDTLTCIISNIYGKYSSSKGQFTAIYNQATGQLAQGKWKSIVPGVVGGGYFSVTKVQ